MFICHNTYVWKDDSCRNSCDLQWKMMTAMVKTSVNFVSRCLTKLNKNALIKIVYTISVVACFGRDAYSSSNIMTQKIMKYKQLHFCYCYSSHDSMRFCFWIIFRPSGSMLEYHNIKIVIKGDKYDMLMYALCTTTYIWEKFWVAEKIVFVLKRC